MAGPRGRGGWRAAAALALTAAAACSDPLAPTDDGGPPVVVKPADTDTGQASVAAENRHGGDAGWKDTGKPNPSLLALWASPYAVSPGDTLDLYVHLAAPTVLLQVYRLGWCGGVGGRLVDSQPTIRGGMQPRCTDRECGRRERTGGRRISMGIGRRRIRRSRRLRGQC